MCGIIGVITTENNCFDILINGLKQLQNRGYDSAGICSIDIDIESINNDSFILHKYASTPSTDVSGVPSLPYGSLHTTETSALTKLEAHSQDYHMLHVGIAHTRWATHGAKTDENSHPHISMDGKFVLVHNGIIENYKELKDMLITYGYIFKSQTDTEVIVNLLSYLHNNTEESASIVHTINLATEMLCGTWGLAIMYLNTPNILYCLRHGSPLLISKNDTSVIVTSEQSGFGENNREYIVLKNNEICIIEKTDNKININIDYTKYELKQINIVDKSISPYPFPHWTLKEIYDQKHSIGHSIGLGSRLLSATEVKLGGIDNKKDVFREIDNLILLGCGTSYHAGMLGVHYFKELCEFNVVLLFDGADFGELDIPRYGSTAVILLSQSGETKDLHRCLDIAKKHNLFTIGVVNVVDSLIAREVDCGCYLNAGREVAVASTKSFTSQVIVLSMIAIWFAQIKHINVEKRVEYISDLKKLQLDVIDMLDKFDVDDNIISKLLPLFTNSSCFILGKGKAESIAREGSLKIKEISYIHTEGYSTSSLKHGPFALLCEGFPVILISPNDEHFVKNENAYQEIQSRGANIIFITDKIGTNKENVILVPENNSYSQLLCIIPIQILAYKISLSKNINPDMPKNLAKVVTVE
jgi:glucosamine--fructose-6-phosphate aminotransferase (isomerizing)